MRHLRLLLTFACLLVISCTEEQEMDRLFQNDAGKELEIKVLTDTLESKAMYTSQYLPSGSEIGVTVLNTSGSNYGGVAYQNVKYTASGSEYMQSWSGATSFKVSGSDGYCYAYYPYNSSVSSLKSIPLTTDGTDYMYATPALVNDNNSRVTLRMNHALTVIRLAFKKGSYSGTGAVTNISVSGPHLGNGGTLDATTGNITASGLNNSISQTVSFTLGSTAANFDLFVVPSATAGNLTLSAIIDGETFSKTVSSTTLEKGKCYTYIIEVNAAELSVTSDGGSGYDASGNPVITSGSYKVTFAGNFKQIGFNNVSFPDKR